MRASLKQLLMIGAAATFVAGCGSNMDDLDAYIVEVKSRPGGRIEPLPEITPPETFAYEAVADGLRSPFRPDTPQSAGPAGPRPDTERSREYLESYSLDTLAMVGTLNIGDTQYGLVQTTSDGLIHRVVPGNYLGQNDGRITSISESEITLVEIISDGIGGYIERDAAVALSD